MEAYKEKEREHYDAAARRRRTHRQSASVTELGDALRMSSYRALYAILRREVPGKRVLDYGCGDGIHALPIAKMGAAEVIGIDLSEESLVIARERAAREDVADTATFLAMDAEALQFPDNSFAIVFDGGAFSSIDIHKGIPEIVRILKPGGLLIGIETLGHHPLANLKRRWNVRQGTRTAWAGSHILKMRDIAYMRDFFEPITLHYFHFISLLALPFERFPGGKLLAYLADATDKMLFLLLPFLKRYGFKVVFVLRKK